MIRFRVIFLVMTVVTILALLAPLVLGLASAVLTYRGICYGFTDGSGPCPWNEYAFGQVFWAALLDIPLSMYLIPAWLAALGFWLYKRRTSTPHELPFFLVALIPLSGCVGGVCLFTILPLLIGFFYRFYP